MGIPTMSLRRRSLIAGGSGLAAAVLVIIIVTFIYSGIGLPGPVSAQAPVAVMVTDPPTLPAGSSALQLNYSGVIITYSTNNGVANLSVAKSGSLNLEDLVNYSQVIGVQDLPVGATIKSVTLDIAAVSVTINGTTYPVTPLSTSLSINIPSGLVSSSDSGVLVDIHAFVETVPVVSSTSGQVTDYYVFIPNAAAVFKPSITKVTPGMKVPVTTNDLNEINATYSAPSLEITNSSMSVSGNMTTMSITIKNTGASNTSLFGVMLSGEFNFSHTTQTHGNPEGGSEDHGAHESNMMFRITGNGTLMMVGPEAEPSSGVNQFVIQAGSSVTLHFTGVLGINAPNGDGESGGVAILPVSGNVYSLALFGPFHRVTGNLTAS